MSSTTPSTNLPHDRTPFFGRDDERAAVAALLARDDIGLLTLTGIGGTGKTRLALAAAAEVAGGFPDGVWFVDLAPVRDAADVPTAFARVLGVREQPDQPLADTLAAAVGSKTVLVVVDNCEHVLEAMPLIGHLLERCPALKVLATSRAPLGVYGERELPIAPLPVVDLGRLGDRPLEGVLPLVERSPAVALFLARAEAVSPGFALTAANARAVVDLCRALDGLPLAIELAAGRTRVLSPEAMCARLDDRLALLTGGARDRPARHQTMRDSLAWSYELLEGDEPVLLRQLGVFVGGFTLAAAEAIGRAAPGIAHPESAAFALDGLVAKGFVRSLGDVAGSGRFALLETVRDFALERLAEAGETASARAAHAGYVFALAERAAPELGGPGQMTWLEILETEHPNIRAALSWGLEEAADRASAVRLALAVRPLWHVHGHFSEARRWFARALEAAPDAPPDLRVPALSAAANLANNQADYPVARGLFTAALAEARAAEDDRSVGRVLSDLGITDCMTGDFERGRDHFAESLAILERVGDPTGVANATNNLAAAADALGDKATARHFQARAVELYRAIGNREHIANAVENLGMARAEDGDVHSAIPLVEEALALRRSIGHKRGMAVSYGKLADLTAMSGDLVAAARLVDASLALHRELGDAMGQCDCMAQASMLAAWPLTHPNQATAPDRWTPPAQTSVPLDRLTAAARLLSASAANRAAIGHVNYDVVQRALDDNRTRLRTALGRRAFDAAWDVGGLLTLDLAAGEAAAEVRRIAAAAPAAGATSTGAAGEGAAAVGQVGETSGPPPSAAEPTEAPRTAPADDGGLTPRELDVAALVAAGLTYAEMAERLSVSVKTVEKHMGSILAKLDARNRRDVAVWGRARGLERPAPPTER